LTNAAESDLAEIWAYIASEASEIIATQFLSAIEQAFQPLLRAPLMGSQREHLGAGLRVIFHSPYAIYYLSTATEVVIVRVLHGARDVVAIANEGGLVE
jgi:toxin ParE1/3/4